MSYLFLIPISIILGLTGLGAFFWAMRHNQYDDMDGAAARVLNTPDRPLARAASSMKRPITPAHGQEVLDLAQTQSAEILRIRKNMLGTAPGASVKVSATD